MREFTGRVAVVTGAASGIGRAIASECAQEGMSVVLADISQRDLAEAEHELQAEGARVVAVRTDVSRHRDMEALAKAALAEFGAVHLLVNNAGVSAGTSVWESTWADWEWVVSVNLWGAIHGVKVFLPIMLAQDADCHIVNTASVAGLISDFPLAPYHTTKHAVVALSESLYHALSQRNSRIMVSVLCPGFVQTRIADSERVRPPELANPPVPKTPTEIALEDYFRKKIASGMAPREVARILFVAMRHDKFYVLTDSESKLEVRSRMESILNDLNPPRG